MSAPKTLTEREGVLLQRAAVNRTVEHFFSVLRQNRCAHCEDIDGRQLAESWYPLPTVTRPRTLEWYGAEFQVRGCHLCYKRAPLDFWLVDTFAAFSIQLNRSPDFLRALADLLEHPTEECEDEGGEL